MKLTEADLVCALDAYNKLFDELCCILKQDLGKDQCMCKYYFYNKNNCKKCLLRKKCIYVKIENSINRLEKRIGCM